MPVDPLYDQSVTVLRAPLIEDRYGQTIPDWDNASETTVSGISWQPDTNLTTAFETVGTRNMVVTGWKLSTPRRRDIDLKHTDRVRHGELVYEVDGDVFRFYLGGSVHHVEARMKRVEG